VERTTRTGDGRQSKKGEERSEYVVRDRNFKGRGNTLFRALASSERPMWSMRVSERQQLVVVAGLRSSG